MPNNYFKGTADAVAQETTAQITAYSAATTYKITIGGVVVSQIGTGGTAATTATALLAVLQASTHPYFTAITWSVVTDTIHGVAKTAGVPFVFTTSVSGGAGTIGAATQVTASAGPNDWSTADNWSLGAVPVAGDTIILRNCSVNICWGLDQSTIAPAKFRKEKSFTGKIGLDYTVFATSADGETVNDAKPEYRTCYLTFLNCIANELEEAVGGGSPAGSGRLMLDVGNGANTVITVFDTATTSADSGRPAIRLKCNVNTAALYVRTGQGGVGIATEIPGETSLLSKISVSDSAQVFVGVGVTVTTYEQQAGTCTLNSAANITTVRANGGTLTIEGDFTITNMISMTGAYIYDNHVKTGGNSVTKSFANGGTVDFTATTRPRTIAAHYNQPGGVIHYNGVNTTITVFATGDCTTPDSQGIVTVRTTAGVS